MRYVGVFLLGTMMVLAAADAGFGGCTASNRETGAGNPGKQVFMDDSQHIPIIPETPLRLFEESDVIAYAKIDTVQDVIDRAASRHPQPEGMPVYPAQRFTATLLWILKGDAAREDRVVSVEKGRSRYAIFEQERRVLYLKQEGDSFHTVDQYGGEHRLASALCDIRNLKKDAESGGIVASFQGDHAGSRPVVHVLRGRQKASLRMNDPAWRRSILKSAPIGPFDVCEISLGRGPYTVLMEIGGGLISHTRFIDGWYATVNVGEYRWWEPLYFAP
jgi:hypothetical protein